MKFQQTVLNLIYHSGRQCLVHHTHPSLFVIIHCALLRKTSPRICMYSILFVSKVVSVIVVRSCIRICMYTVVFVFVCTQLYSYLYAHTQLYLYLYVHICICICMICMSTVSPMQSIAQKGIAQHAIWQEGVTWLPSYSGWLSCKYHSYLAWCLAGWCHLESFIYFSLTLQLEKCIYKDNKIKYV